MKGLAFIALVAAGVFWGLGFPLGKLVMRETDASNMVFLRFLAAAVAAAPYALRRADVRALFRSPVVWSSAVLYGLAFLVQFEGLARSTVALAALLVGLMPALIAVCARLLGDKVGWLSWVGVAAASAGAAVIAGRPGGEATPLGVALMLISFLLFLGWLVVLRRAPPSPTPMAVSAITMIVGCLTVLPFTLVMHGAPKLNLSWAAWTAVIAQGVLSTFLANAAWQFGLRHVSSASAGVFVNIEPLMGASLGVLMFGDRLTPALLIGGALIVVGSLVVVLGEGRPEAVTPA